ncbi:mercury(II) reductase [Candidatus Daviesbacteria bacterium RIFCSPHIGHO2_01_FULL_40_24]|nr:MAG: Mercuric reductase [Candidatus Daviesbacteria bacterium GW2011_GWA2_39_33]OGE21629.1 MAG: mercury(II) reductase [Candidatus Daviesbacteria bacterium RIFCSPHIGHO2_01_FULL_40_24]OGE30026.1 MAG: mercury(II) reductase [Candidatus Daviesbacteria bacterium RIFCSPHIGHO2_02_FULL_40_16]OGE43539.1 MAG: mercury(II) reductase [Candidatus Daviesbacteria bacterium RIFCSPLOWO2_01_FULL_39_23]OGE67812.1 MAG: mercury(II) reductase [Candidatus Daviesbacteria bacterium RIFCSPLOWO2_02_FULL_39_13]
MQVFDLIIVGGGAGAFAAAIKANELGAKTLMVNKGLPLGGTCVNVGCVPSKTLLWAGEVMHLAKNHSIPGVNIEVKDFDFSQVVQHELDLVAKLRTEKYEKVLNGLENIAHIEGKAAFVSPNEIEVDGQKFQAKKFIIAAGSTATVPPIDGIKKVGYLTHIEALQIKKQPKELIVVGAGPLGLEFAQMYSRFGTKVTILQRSDSIFPPAERELTDKLTEILTNEGIIIRTGVQVQSARREGDKKILTYIVDDKQEEVSADEILLATGKTPNTERLALDKADVEVDEKQAIKVSPGFQSSQANIFAVGDVTNLLIRQEPTAGREGTLAAENALKNAQNSIDYHSVPWTIFTDPQLAGVGLTEEQEIKQIGSCLCRTVSFADVPKAHIIGRTEGLIKMIIHPETKVILGVHILSPNAGDLVAQAMWLVKNKNTVDDVVSSLPMFPTLSEALKIVALSFTKDISKLSCCV